MWGQWRGRLSKGTDEKDKVSEEAVMLMEDEHGDLVKNTNWTH